MRRHTRQIIETATLLAALLWVSCRSACAIPPDSPGGAVAETGVFSASNGTLVRIESGGKKVTGRIVASDRRRILLLRQDGQVVEFERQLIDSAGSISGSFRPYSSLRMQKHLQGIFGKRYEVSRTAHYVVVHPRGQRRQWADPFEEYFNRFTTCFAARGYALSQPEFPLIVVVVESPYEFSRIAARDGLANSAGYSGYYSSSSNWIVTRSTANSRDDRQTLIHESFHQFAFNTGIHQRWSATPRWCAEGLATMFESPGYHDSQRNPSARDRQHEYYLNWLKHELPREETEGLLEALIAGDSMFESDTRTAYGLSWGLAWYLAETRQAQFNAYLQRIAQRPRSVPYTRADRLADFRQAFGLETPMLSSHLLKFVDSAR